jgi:hypothetical protein
MTAIIDAIQGPGGLDDSATLAATTASVSQTSSTALLTAIAAPSALPGLIQGAADAIARSLPLSQVPNGKMAGYIEFNDGTKIVSGIGAPNGAVYGSVPDIFLRRDGAAGGIMWVKTSGTNTDTGWAAVA